MTLSTEKNSPTIPPTEAEANIAQTSYQLLASYVQNNGKPITIQVMQEDAIANRSGVFTTPVPETESR